MFIVVHSSTVDIASGGAPLFDESPFSTGQNTPEPGAGCSLAHLHRTSCCHQHDQQLPLGTLRKGATLKQCQSEQSQSQCHGGKGFCSCHSFPCSCTNSEGADQKLLRNEARSLSPARVTGVAKPCYQDLSVQTSLHRSPSCRDMCL